jgi:hypothetical protein
MDLRVYYQKLRKIETELIEPFVVLVSRETPDGGKPGVMTEVPRSVAAKMAAEERADIATPEQSTQFRNELEQAWKAAMAVADLAVEIAKPVVSAIKTGKKL